MLILAAVAFVPMQAHAVKSYDFSYRDGDVLRVDTVWNGRVLVDGVLFVPEGVTLTVAPGTTVCFAKSESEYRESGLSEAVIPGSGLRVEGKIIARGLRDKRITFTSAEEEPVPGDWGCIFFDHSKGSEFVFCRFEYAKYTVHAHFSRLDVSRSEVTRCVDGSRIGYSRASYTNCDIHGNTGKGLNFADSRNTVAYCNITSNYEGIFLNQHDDACVIRDNNIHSNAGMDLRLGEFHDTDVRLAGNWWGTSDAAKIEAKVYDRADDEAIGDAVLRPAKEKVCNAGAGGAYVETVWKFETGGFVDSTPAVADGRVYFGSWDSHLYCLDEDTGKLIWKYKTGDCVDSSPAVYGGRVYFASWDLNVYCLDAADGKLVWKFGMEPSNFDDHRQSSPGLWPEGGLLYIGGFNGKIYALDMETGKEEWVRETGGPIRTRPVVACAGTAGGAEKCSRVITGSSDGHVYSFDLKTGGTVWDFDAGAKVLTAPAVGRMEGGRYGVFFGTDGRRLYSLDVETGKVLWGRDTPGRFIYSSPLVHDTEIIAGDCEGALRAYDINTGDEIWSTPTGGVIYSPPVMHDGMIVFGNNDGKLYFVSPDSGEKIAEYSVIGPLQAVFSSKEAVFAGSRDNFLRSIRLSD